MMVWPHFYLGPVEEIKKYHGWQKPAYEWTQTILYVIVLYLAFTTVVAEPYQIPSGSMEPTLHGDPHILIGDRVISLKWISTLRAFQRGDIIVFISAEDNKTFIVKRLVGFPGDKIEVKPPRVWVNDKPLTGPIFDHITYTDPRIPKDFEIKDVTHPDIAKIVHDTESLLKSQYPDYKLLTVCSVGQKKFFGTYYRLYLECRGTQEKSLQVVIYEDMEKNIFLATENAQKFLPINPDTPYIQILGEKAFSMSKTRHRSLENMVMEKVYRADTCKIFGDEYFLVLHFHGKQRTFIWQVMVCKDQNGNISLTQLLPPEERRSLQPVYGIDTPFIVPQNSYFVMGDNSRNSNDGRWWGHLPQTHVLGKAVMVFWPIHNAKILP